MKKKRRFRNSFGKDQRGQSIYIIAISVPVLLAFLALSLDIGLAFAERRQMQNAADAAATAATRVITVSAGSSIDADVKQAIDTYAQLNQGTIDYANRPPQYLAGDGSVISAVGAGGNIPANARGVAVDVETTLGTFFASVLARSVMDVSARSAAVSYASQMPRSMPGLVPLGVPLLDFQSGESYDLWSPHYHSYYGVDPQYKGVLDFSSGQGDGYVAGTDWGNKPNNANNWCADGYDGTIAISNTLDMYNGNLGNNVASGLRTNVLGQGLSDAGGQYGIIYIPLWDDYDAGKVRVAGFAAFKLYYNDIEASSAAGVFVSYAVPDGIVDPSGGIGYGPKVVKMVSPTNVPTPGPTSTPVPTLVSTATPGGATATPTATTVPGSTATPTPTSGASGTATPTPTQTATPIPTSTPTPCPAVSISAVVLNPAGNSGKVDVTWTTNVAADSLVEWGTTTSYGTSVSSAAFTTSHGLQMQDIANNTLYYYRITSTSSCGQTTTSAGTYTR